ncbi:MAG: glycosyltransferase [Myxococcota bacterium]
MSAVDPSWWLAAVPALPLAVTLLNLATWRAPAAGGAVPRVSALVPARDEAATIEACVRALLAEPVAEVLVYDDGSTDDTASRVAALAAADPRVRLLSGVPLPAGWVGKPHACHRLAEAATGEVLLFVDADTRLLPGALARLCADDADLVTVFPGQRIGSLGEGLVVPLLHLTYLSWLPLALVRRTRDPRVLAANGQVLRVTRAAYDRVGGFAAVRDQIVDDMALCRAAKAAGLRVAFVPGEELATCRMYASAGEAWRGFSKNLYPGLGSPLLALVVAGLYTACFVAPWVLLPLWPGPAAAGVACNLAQRALIACPLPPAGVDRGRAPALGAGLPRDPGQLRAVDGHRHRSAGAAAPTRGPGDELVPRPVRRLRAPPDPRRPRRAVGPRPSTAQPRHSWPAPWSSRHARVVVGRPAAVPARRRARAAEPRVDGRRQPAPAAFFGPLGRCRSTAAAPPGFGPPCGRPAPGSTGPGARCGCSRRAASGRRGCARWSSSPARPGSRGGWGRRWCPWASPTASGAARGPPPSSASARRCPPRRWSPASSPRWTPRTLAARRGRARARGARSPR